MGFTEIHSHFIYGVDDGVRCRADMELMLDAAHRQGISTLYSTPHVAPGVRPFDWALYFDKLDEARSYCRYNRLPIDLRAGAEVMYTPLLDRHAADGDLPTLEGTNSVLMEAAPAIDYAALEGAVDVLERSGYDVILAHVERYECLFHSSNARRLQERHEVRYQVNCNSIINRPSIISGLFLHKWLKNGYIDYVASDAHDTRRRPFNIAIAYRVLKERYGEKLAALVTGLERSR